MATESRKRPAEAERAGSPTKRQRLQSAQTILSLGPPGLLPSYSPAVTTDELAKKGLRRGIALALQKVGFDSAAPEAMESFAAMAEMYITSLVQDIKTFTNAARRSHPVPKDFEQGLKRFNLTTSTLNPHRKPPIPRSKRLPKWEPLETGDPLDRDLPVLGDELDGAPDKAAKPYIPSSFPAFPSVHTYKYTPESVDAVTVSDDWSAFGPDAPSQTLDGSQPQSQKPQRPLAPDEIPRGDPKKMREAAAKEAKAGEGALRRLMRASKIAKQKEVWASAQRQPAQRERYNLWEAAMRELLDDDTRSKGKEIGPAGMHGDKGRFEIADHSMLVNWEKSYSRRDVPRAGVRKTASAGHSGKGQ
ncbi:Bromodomain associated-domain-containing protein [Chaetomium strumarium]|uniref:Transcription initiation factor TFIID subunit 8 n=1 Tax=Chaetomium strumarium TaxID=1170767 RepID=A0AAJ0GS60_9PEZI|nr:Bromodomain associated-domain-containing protein [Chaetomium strumarium]